MAFYKKFQMRPKSHTEEISDFGWAQLSPAVFTPWLANGIEAQVECRCATWGLFASWGSMASDYTSRTNQQQVARLSAIGPIAATSVRARPVRARPLSDAIAKMLALEFAIVAAAAYLASFLYHLGSKVWPPAYQYIPAALLIGLLVLIVSLTFRHFDSIQTQPRHRFLWSGLRAVGLAFSFFLTLLFILKISEDYSRGSFVAQAVTVAFAVVATRALAYSRLQSAIAAGLLAARRVILIGDEDLCTHFTHRLKETGIVTIGSFDFPSMTALMKMDGELEPTSSIQGILDLCRNWHPDDIIILVEQDSLRKLQCLTNKLSELPVNVHVVPRDTIDLLATSRIVEFGNLSTFQVSSPPLTPFDRAIKRAFDLVVAATGLVLLSPFFLCIAAAIKLDSPGPVFFRQTRHGYNNQNIRVFKFRSLTTLENGSDFKQVQRNDARITTIGRILRKTNMDELPQLINVLLGEMSIVGPRPHATAHNEMFVDRILPFARRHNVKPGITGWAQVNGARGLTDTLEKMEKRIELDLYYIDNWSFLFDAKIIIMTLFSKRSYLNAY
jgi:putative colanic acid biosynthesis UDP-glucose lipid carrier transferase